MNLSISIIFLSWKRFCVSFQFVNEIDQVCGLPKNITLSAENVMSLTHLVNSLGSDDFELALYNFIADHEKSIVLYAFEIHDGMQVDALFTITSLENEMDIGKSISQEYASFGFTYDKVLQAQQAQPVGSANIITQYPQDCAKEFRRKYFEPLSIVEEIDFFQRREKQVFYMGCCAQYQSFDAVQALRIRALMPLVGGIFNQHLIIKRIRNFFSRIGTSERKETIYKALLYSENELTKREALVCAEIACGYQTEAIALRLGISLHTVTTHRKNAYAKLKISSKNEIFLHCMNFFSESIF